MKIKGKQIADYSITQQNLNITTDTIITSTSVTNKEYVDNAVNSGINNLTYSSADFNLSALFTSGSTPLLATNTQISDIPLGGVRVYVNGIEVNVGSGLTCFFAPEGVGIPTPRYFGEEQQNDYLWWNCGVALYQLEITDEIDYVYMTYTPLI
jgi:hypothetical protein